MGELPLFPAGADVSAATSALLDDGIGDGLPVVPPTPDRVDAMLERAAPGPDAPIGPVPPLFGELTVRAAAWYAVLAGCRPPALPVVLAALRACLEPEFNLLGVQTTTGTAAVAVVVRGPVVDELGLTTGSNLLGPGNRANASVGRAVALALTGVGGARPGETDMATTGWPGRYGLCIPVPGPAAHRGGSSASADPSAAASTVTVLAVGGTAEVLPRAGGGTVDEILGPIADAFAGAALAAGDPHRMASCEQTLVLPPEPAAALERLGVPADDVVGELYRRGNAVLADRRLPDARVAAGPDAVHVLVTGGPGIKMLHLPGWIGGSRAVTRPLG